MWKAPERRVPESNTKNCKNSNRTALSGWILPLRLEPLFGLRIEWNKSLNRITFRDALDGEIRSQKFIGTQNEVARIAMNTQKPKTKSVANIPKCSNMSLDFINLTDYGNTS